MEQLLKAADIGYIPRPDLANHYESLSEYADWIQCIYGKHQIEKIAAGAYMLPDRRICIVCAEGDVFEKDGTTPRCHRWYVLKALLEQLGPEWTGKHL